MTFDPMNSTMHQSFLQNARHEGVLYSDMLNIHRAIQNTFHRFLKTIPSGTRNGDNFGGIRRYNCSSRSSDKGDRRGGIDD